MNPSSLCQYWNPGKLIFGPNALDELKKEIRHEEIPLLVTDEGIARSGILARLAALLREMGVRYHVFDRVEPEPSLEVVENAAQAFRSYGCTAVIGLGGGSAMDAAKAVCIRGTQEASLAEVAAGRPLVGRLPSLYAIPTTAGTGSEVTAVAIISDSERKLKIPIKNPLLTPSLAVLDPLLLCSLPSKVAAETGADALSHAIEAYVGIGSHPITDALALAAIRMISRNAVQFMANPADVEAAGQMLLASSMAGMSFNNAGLGLVHSLAHPVGAYFHLSHGLSCALYLPVVMEFNASACPEKFACIAGAMGRDLTGLQQDAAAEQAVSAVRDLLEKLRIPRRISRLGATFRLDPKMVDEVLASRPASNNPRKADRDQVVRLFEAAA